MGRSIHTTPEDASTRSRAETRGAPEAISGAQDLRRLQSSIGNRAMGNLLARLYDPELAASESVVQAPVMWVKYPPPIETMSRIELFDAIELLDEWLLGGHKHYVSELRALQGRLRTYAHQVTTPVEYRTYSRFARMPPHLLKEAYERQVQKVLADRRLYPLVSFDALDEVVRARFPGAKWLTGARGWLEGYLREEDRRSERFSKLWWYQRASFEKFDAKANRLDAPGAELWRELAWQWIGLSDARVERQAIEVQLVDGLGALYEQLLREIDGLIQKECSRRHPETWTERLSENLYKAWGDPCKPWFGPDGTHGPHELNFFKVRLRLKRDDDPFACVYYWVEEYVKSKRLLTDPQAQLEALQSQAAGALFLHWATIMEFTPEIATQVRAVGQYMSRTGGKFLQHTMLGYRLALGDLGGSGAEVGAGGGRPTIAVVSPSSPAGARPPVVRGPETPDPPPTTSLRGQAASDASAAKPDANVPATTPRAAAPPTTGSPRLPTSAVPKWTPPPAPSDRPPPPPKFVKARTLGYASPQADPAVAGRLRQAIVSAVSIDIKSGTRDTNLPPGWKAMYEALESALRRNADDVSSQVLAVLHVVWAALRNPELYGDVIVEAWRRAMIADTSVDTELIAMAEANAGTKAVWIPRHLADWLLANSGAFWDLYAAQPTPFVDMPLMGDPHRALSHLIQDLVVDLAFKRAKINMTSAQFRGLLAKLKGTIKPTRVVGGPVIAPGGAQGIPLGDFVWQMTYDLYVNSKDQLPQPEAFGQALHALLQIQ